MNQSNNRPASAVGLQKKISQSNNRHERIVITLLDSQMKASLVNKWKWGGGGVCDVCVCVCARARVIVMCELYIVRCERRCEVYMYHYVDVRAPWS